jgi:hypothetical protein
MLYYYIQLKEKMENKINIAQMFEGPAHNLVWKNRYNEIIDEVYDKYDELFDSYYPAFSAPYPKRLTKEELVQEIKNGGSVLKEFQLDVKITERELSFEERQNYGVDILGYESLLDYGHSQNDDDIILELLNIWNVPTKVITLDYKNEIVKYYEY